MCAPMIAAAGTALSTMSASTMFAVSLGVSALTTGIQYVAQMEQAQYQAEVQGANLQATRDAAVADMARQHGDLDVRAGQVSASTALRLQNQKDAAAQAKATASATSEAAGLSFDGLMADFDRQYTSFADAEMQQLGWDLDQIDRAREGIYANAQSRVNTVPRTPIQNPSLLAAGASFAGSALGAYDRYSVRDPITGQRTLT